MKSKELVTLREKPMKNGGSSLYLDYTINGERCREVLKMYIVPENTRIDKLQNAETMKMALAKKAERIIALQSGDVESFRYKREGQIMLTDFLKDEMKAYSAAGKDGMALGIKQVLNWVERYDDIPIAKIDETYLLGMMRLMRTGEGKKKPLSENTIMGDFNILSICFNHAVRRKKIKSNPIELIDKVNLPHKSSDHERQYLTLEELKRISKTEILNKVTKRAFLFSCFTGLRISDIYELTWENIKKLDNGYAIMKRQVKTGGLVTIPLSENAMQYLGPIEKSGKVFKNLKSRPVINSSLKTLMKKSGINKNISFHCARHTFATLLLTYDTDIYTVSKLLGHSSVATTQIYAKIVDKKKEEAVSNIPKL